MRTGVIISIFTISVIILLGFFSSTGNFTTVNDDLTIIETQDIRTLTQAHDPIVIYSNSDFEDQGWPGNGTASSPYMISDLEVRANSTFPAITIAFTDAFFVIERCTLLNGSHYSTVEMSDVQNGAIDDCVISGPYHSTALWMDRVTSCNVSRCRTESLLLSIGVRDSSSCNFRYNSGVRIYLTNSTGFQVLHNQFDSDLDIAGPELQYWIHTIENNTIHGGKFGFFSNISNQVLDVSEYSRVLSGFCTDSTFQGGLFSGSIEIHYSTNCMLKDTTFIGELSAVSIQSSNHTTMDNCVMIPEEGIIRVRNSYRTTISNCNISLRFSRGFVFWIDESPSNLILNNTLNFFVGEDGYHYTGIIWGDDSIVEGNTILGAGVAMGGDNLRIVDNAFLCSLDVMLANNSLIQNNTISGVSYGNPAALYLSNSDNVLIIDNSIINNNAYGIHIYDCTNCMIYSNQIGWNSAGNAYDDDGQNNLWDNGVDKGNAWSDYSGQGEYEIDGTTGSVDRFPTLLRSPQEEGLEIILVVVIVGITGVALVGGGVIFLKKRRA